MPELPEVETVKRSLKTNTGARVIDVHVRRADIIRSSDYTADELRGLKICNIDRRGKYLDLCMEANHHVVVHMGMSGRFYMQEADLEITEPHVHWIMDLDNGQRLIYRDARRFGGIWLMYSPEILFERLGVEPLSSSFNPGYLRQICAGRRVAIKTLLLNQQLIAGIGNIYADEALFMAGILPDRAAGQLTDEEIERLQLAVVEVLSKGISRRGTTFRDYRDGFNQEGENQHFLAVYGKTGQACKNCGQAIEKIVIGGRSSHFCPNCQH